MENQHQKITGYRDLSQAEIDLMNKIKAAGAVITALQADVTDHLDKQNLSAMNIGGQATNDEQTRIRQAEPRRWAAIARTDFQTAMMALTRAVAQPTSF